MASDIHYQNPDRLLDARKYGFSQISIAPGTIIHIAGQTAADAREAVGLVERRGQRW